MSEATVSEEQVLHNELSFEINQELIHLMKRIVEIQRVNKQLKENNMSMQEEMVRTWKKLDDLQQIEQEHQKINGELREENQKYKEIIDKAIEFTNKKWGTWCTHHLEYMTELQNILKEGNNE